MLRFFVLLLLAANGFFYAWSHGHLSQWGLVASSQQESFRLKEQIEPERIVIRQGDKAMQPALVPTPAPAPITTHHCERTAIATNDHCDDTTRISSNNLFNRGHF